MAGTAAQFTECEFLCVGENTERLIFFSPRKRSEKEKSDSKIFYKNYSLRFLIVWDLSDSLDSINSYNTKCKRFMKCKTCKSGEKCKDDGIEWCEICKTCKKLSNYCKD